MQIGDKLRIEVVVKENRKTAFLKGVVDEDTVFTPLTKLGSPLVLNLKDITSINSCGIRSWVNFLKDLGSTVQVSYEECPPVIVRQMNMVPSFMGRAKVISVFAPYVCDNCEKEKMVLINSESFSKGNIQVRENFVCEFCQKGEMELDGQPEQYFAFSK
jgi:hypothetical protein